MLAANLKFDVDDNGSADALSDGIVILRYLQGFTGDVLIEGVVDASGGRNTSEAIVAELDAVYADFLDVDGNGDADPLSDGIVIIRYLAGFSGEPLVQGAVSPQGTRTDPTDIEAFLNRPLDDPLNPSPAPTVEGAETGFVNSLDHQFTWRVEPDKSIEFQCVQLEGPNGLEIPWAAHTSNQVRLSEIAGGAGVQLSDGQYRIGVQVRVDGVWSEKTFTNFVLDTMSPVITNVSILDGASTSAETLWVSYDVDDSNLGSSNQTSRREEQSYELIPGQNMLSIAATDLAGNSTTRSINVTFEPSFNLPADLETFREELVSSNLELFTFGDGIASTGVPIDAVDESGSTVDINNSAPGVQTQTQPTALGFQIVSYASIIAGLVPDAETMREAAITSLNNRLDQIVTMQEGHGLIPWYNVAPLTASRTEVASFDNLNLLEASVATLGLIEESGFESTVDGASIAQKLETVIANLRSGFAKLVNGDGQLHQTQNLSDASLSAGTIDRLGAEGRGGTALLVAIEQADATTTGIDLRTWQNLILTTALYETVGGRTVEAITPFDGGGFQSLWNTIFLPEQEYEIDDVLWNFVIAQMDNANKNGLAGILSASSVPNVAEYQYEGLIGLPELAERDGEQIRFDVASLYSLAAAVPLAPEAILGELKRILDDNSDLVGTKGLFDSKQGDQVSRIHLAIDQLSLVTGLTHAGQIGTRAFLDHRGLDDDVRQLYASSFEPVYSAPRQWPEPPLAAEETEKFSHVESFDLLASSNWDPGQITPGPGQVSSDIDAGTLAVRSEIVNGFTGGRLGQSVLPSNYRSLLLHVQAAAITEPIEIAVKLESDSGESMSYPIKLRSPAATVVEVFFDATDVPMVDILLLESLPQGIDIEITRALFLTNPLTSPEGIS